jgi:hypothetical protein
MVLGFVQLWVPCSSFVDISPSDVMLDISSIDVECRTVEDLDVFALLNLCPTNMAATPAWKTLEFTLLSLRMLLSNY